MLIGEIISVDKHKLVYTVRFKELNGTGAQLAEKQYKTYDLMNLLSSNEIYLTNAFLSENFDFIFTDEHYENTQLITFLDRLALLDNELKQSYKIRYKLKDGKLVSILKAVADLSERRIIDTLVLPPVDIIKSNTQMMPNLNKIIVHNQTKELEKMAFFMCSGKEIILGKGIKVIGMQAFAYSKFETITILSDDYTLCEEALIKTKRLKTIKGLDGARLIEENALGVGLYKMELRDCGLERQSLTNTRHLYIKEYVDIFKELTVNNCTIHISKEDYNRLKHKITGTYTVTFE